MIGAIQDEQKFSKLVNFLHKYVLGRSEFEWTHFLIWTPLLSLFLFATDVNSKLFLVPFCYFLAGDLLLSKHRVLSGRFKFLTELKQSNFAILLA